MSTSGAVSWAGSRRFSPGSMLRRRCGGRLVRARLHGMIIIGVMCWYTCLLLVSFQSRSFFFWQLTMSNVGISRRWQGVLANSAVTRRSMDPGCPGIQERTYQRRLSLRRCSTSVPGSDRTDTGSFFYEQQPYRGHQGGFCLDRFSSSHLHAHFFQRVMYPTHDRNPPISTRTTFPPSVTVPLIGVRSPPHVLT